jgi:signal transduction histidine kinase
VASEDPTSERWQQAFTGELARLGLGALLTLFVPEAGKALIYDSNSLDPTEKSSPTDAKRRARSAERLANGSLQPTATHTFPLGSTGAMLALDLYAEPLDRDRQLLAAAGSGLAALLAGAGLLIWGATRWVVAPLRQLSAQVDDIAGGDPIEPPPSSRIREVANVATAIDGMATALARTAERDARMEAERRFLVSAVAHDLRTPLFALRGYLDAVSAGMGPQVQHVERARTKAAHIDRLVTSLFAYARADLDDQSHVERADLGDAVHRACAAFETAANEGGVALRVTGDTIPVSIDRDAFERAIGNVIDNALRHTRPGGAIDVTYGSDADGAYVRVADDGPGIAPDVLPRVFEPMVRGDGARSSRTGGAGLGLTIAARLLERQGGAIDAVNRPGDGAVLTLRLRPAS